MIESLLVILAIVLAIYLGEKFNFNTGIIAMAFAYLIGTFILGMPLGDFLATFPVKLFLVIFGISFFFNYAVVNGTLDKLAHKILHSFRNFTRWLPLVLYFVTALISGMGAGYFSSVAIMAVIGMTICEVTGLNRLTVSMAISLGALSGGNFMPSVHGALFNNLLQQTELASQSMVITRDIFAVSFIYPIFILLFMMFVDRKQVLNKDIVIEEQAPFTAKQKANIGLIAALMLIVLGAPILAELNPNVEWINYVNDRVDISLLAIVAAIIAHFMRLADGKEHEVTAKIPWSTIWLVTGVGMLIDVAVEAGTIDMLANLITQMPSFVVPLALTLIGGVMSIFSSTLGVVAPVMFPMIAGISASSGWDPSLLAIAVIIGSQSTSIAPFSSGGSLLLASSNFNEDDQKEFYHELLYKGTLLGLAFSLVAVLVLMFIPYFH